MGEDRGHGNSDARKLHSSRRGFSETDIGLAGRSSNCRNGIRRLETVEVVRLRGGAASAPAGTVVLRGNLSPDGAVLKRSAATPGLLQSRGQAVVFDNLEDMDARVDDPALEVNETSVLVLRNCGPAGYPGMPEVGNIPIPRRLLEAGI